MKNISSLLIVSLLSGSITLGAYKVFFDESGNNKKNAIITQASPYQTRNVSYNGSILPDFTSSAESTINTVVHVKNVSIITVSNPIIEFMYGFKGGTQQAQVGTGSGVIISEDGYIVTNNHVIKDATEIEITLNNNKSYKAKLIGTDSKTDIALLKIDAEEKLPYVVFGDSDNIKVGEWVLAVGNPYNLNSTVTAGIVSAKARNIGHNTNNIQSFIQTDAAVNPGNSGGALVNTRGELVGINTMISSNTGSYVGYSFAVPSNITRKIVEDLMEYGNVQRGVLGVRGGELNSTIAKELGIDRTQGFYIDDVTKNSGAYKAGLKKGDVIIKIDNQNINSFSELNGYISTKRPNEEIEIQYLRDSKLKTAKVVLTKAELLQSEFLGMDVENLSKKEQSEFKIDYGVKIVDAKEFGDELNNKVIISINGKKINDIDTLSSIINSIPDGSAIKIELLNKNRQIERYMVRK